MMYNNFLYFVYEKISICSIFAVIKRFDAVRMNFSTAFARPNNAVDLPDKITNRS